VKSIPTGLREKVDVSTMINMNGAKVPIHVKEGFWSGIMGAMFGPPG
jgi:hypothetical protein